MKKLSLLVFLIFSFSGFSQDCKDFKKGTFKVKMEGGGYVAGYKVIRRNNIQLEKTSQGYLKCKVVWLDECTYQLIHIKSDFLDIPAGNVVTVKIIKTREDSYDGVGSAEGGNEVSRFTMKRI